MTNYRPFSQFENSKPPVQGAFSWVDNCSSLWNGNALGLDVLYGHFSRHCSSLWNGNALGPEKHRYNESDDTALLKERGMSQKELAEVAGLTNASVCRYVNGKRESRMAAIAALSRTLGVEPSVIIGHT